MKLENVNRQGLVHTTWYDVFSERDGYFVAACHVQGKIVTYAYLTEEFLNAVDARVKWNLF